VTRIVVVGAGFGGTHVAWNLERLCRDQQDLELLLVSRDNYFLMTPFLFEACSGALQLTHCSVPIRDYLRRTSFLEAVVDQVDLHMGPQ
jgi:NADH dehydrogenase